MRLRLNFAFICLVIAGLIFTFPCLAKIEPGDIAGIWLLDDGAGEVATDSSDNGNDGEIFGASWTDGKFGKALEFDGVSNHVDVIEANNFPTESNPRSITAWFYTETPGSTYKNNISSIVQQADDTNGAGKLFCVARRYYPDTDTETVGLWGNSRNVLGVDGEIELDIWNFVAVTCDGSTTKLYVNGEERMSGTPALDTSGAHKNNFYMARLNDTNYNGVFNGIVDEVGFFRMALTDSQINDIMNQGLARAALGLAAVSPAGKLATRWGLLKN